MVRVRLAPLDSKMYLGRGHRAAVEEPWSHLPVLHQTLPRSGPPVPPPQPFQKLDLTCCGTEEAIRVSPVGGSETQRKRARKRDGQKQKDGKLDPGREKWREMERRVPRDREHRWRESRAGSSPLS